MNRCASCNQFSKALNARFCWHCGERLLGNNELHYLSDLQETYLRTLYILKDKAARYGIEAPAYIILEIEDLHKSITEVARKIAILRSTSTSKLTNKIIEVMFKRTSPNLIVQHITTLEISLAADVNPEHIQIVSSNDEYFVLRFQAPDTVIDQFIARYKINSQLTTLLGIEKVIEVINIEEDVNLESTMGLCRCAIEEKDFYIYFKKSTPTHWLATSIDTNLRFYQGTQYKFRMKGFIDTAPTYPGCPYCGAKGFFKHIECSRITCWIPHTAQATCVWCNLIFNVTAGIHELDGEAT